MYVHVQGAGLQSEKEIFAGTLTCLMPVDRSFTDILSFVEPELTMTAGDNNSRPKRGAAQTY